ncbi:thioredoxin-dependent thiol peroxidase [Paenibacillus motobuensis]|uniref:thioredoxin-dependent thiol peroxidase n=1 Tax=Paenibacillus TaxID=44249 RepID=UPI00203D7354|nr:MULTISPECIES: thioredoxin-dependent thiol peroxidase [Paenibacillus]MCM3042689.1 thioredoxin-dependent thiol peroxidase [Paenibacillus lutimineralis]MCM3649793.1 thioredoxin-dependent thiol peroxidase [Paenibacillus motobuensis]
MNRQSVELGQTVPDFTLPASGGNEVSLNQFRGQKVVIYFYPKDMTTACTQEACDFRDNYSAISERDAVVLGISGDPVKSHDRFVEKQSLPFLLLSDADHEICRMFGVWQLKKMYGREYEGIVRSTFLIDEEGRLVREWRGIRVKGHVEKVLEAIREGV